MLTFVNVKAMNSKQAVKIIFDLFQSSQSSESGDPERMAAFVVRYIFIIIIMVLSLS